MRMGPRGAANLWRVTARCVLLAGLALAAPVFAEEQASNPPAAGDADKERIRNLEQPAKEMRDEQATSEADRARIRTLEQEVAKLIAEIAALQAQMDANAKGAQGALGGPGALGGSSAPGAQD